MPNIFRKGLFDGQVAIVTGGGSGIGLYAAIALGELGARVAICGRKRDKLEAAEQKLRALDIDVFADACDIREVDQIAAFAPKDEHMSGVRILCQHRLRHRAQSGKAAAHIRHPCRDPDAGARR